MRLMYDAIDIYRVPLDAELVAFYIDGQWAITEAEARARFPNAVLVPISVIPGTRGGVVIDVEDRAWTPQLLPGAVLDRRAQGIDPTGYCSASLWQACRDECAARGVPQPHWWIADWDNDPTIGLGMVAKQYQSTGVFDLSSVADYWPGIDTQPGPAPVPVPLEVLNMASAIAVVMNAQGTGIATIFTEGADGHLGQWVPPNASGDNQWHFYDITAAVAGAGGPTVTLAT